MLRLQEGSIWVENRVAPTRCPCGRRGVSLRLCPPPPSASVSHCPYMQGCVHAFLVQTCLCA